MPTCRKCGSKISDQYSFCPNCLTPIIAEKTKPIVLRKREKTEATRGISRPNTKMRKLERFRTWIGKPNTLETYFVYVFLLSIFLGIVFGFFDQTFYYAANAQLPRATSGFDIFFYNFRNDILVVLTGGVLVLFSNFITFAAVSGLIAARHLGFLVAILVIAVAFGTYGILEMAGHLCFGLIGFTFLERVFLKKKTQLHRLTLFLLGTASVFVAAIVEWSLEVAVRKIP